MFLELLETPSNDLAAGVLMSRMPAGDSILLTIDVRQQIDSSSWPDIDLPSQGGDSVIDPVVIEWCEFVS